jgi:type II secretory pathway component GspD/PulD (secretin)
MVLLLGSCAHGRGTPPSGETIDLDVNDVDVDAALIAVATRARINVFLDPDVRGRVNVHVRSTPWRDALAIIAKQLHLRVEELEVAGAMHASVWITSASSPSAPQTRFTGHPIDVHFDDMPIRAAVNTIADAAHVPIAVDDDIQQAVTMHSRGPWDLALYHLAQKSELRVVREGNAFRITRR